MRICIVSLNIIPYFHGPDDSRSGEGRAETDPPAGALARYGGAEVQAALLADAFAEAGATVQFVVSDLENGCELPHAAQNAFFSKRGLPGLRFFHPRTAGILSALARADADVYFQHCAGSVTGLTAWFCKRHRRVFVYYAGSDSDFSFRTARLGNMRDKMIFFWGLKNAGGIVAQNEFQAKLCRERLHREPCVIPSAVAADAVPRTGEDGSIAWVGTLRAVKRPELFLELARSLPERKFVLIGGAMGAEMEYSRRIIEMAATMPNVVATGRIPRQQVEEYLAGASLLANTSRVEGFPNAFLEAWKHATPVLSLVDVDDLIRKERVGVVCGDIREMADCIEKLLADDETRAEMGRRARRLVEERYAASVLARKYLSYFGELLASARGRAR